MRIETKPETKPDTKPKTTTMTTSDSTHGQDMHAKGGDSMANATILVVMASIGTGKTMVNMVTRPTVATTLWWEQGMGQWCQPLR